MRVKSLVHAADVPTNPKRCIVSYAGGLPEHERWVERVFTTDLKNAEIEVFLNRWGDPADTSFGSPARQVEKCEALLVLGTPLYREKYETRVPLPGKRYLSVVAHCQAAARPVRGSSI